MAPVRTQSEPDRIPVAKVRLLTYVLTYDDLLADATHSYRLEDDLAQLAIGRAAEPRDAGMRMPGELRLFDPWLSGRHAVLEHRDGTDVVQDLRSANGTYVNGVRVMERVLSDGDLIEVGHCLLVYRVVEKWLLATLEGLDERLRFGQTRTHCPEVAMLLRNLGNIASSRESVLILGETGAGKEFAGETIHRLSNRRGAYCAVDCGAVPENLFESTFFGHQRGSFTGAATSHTGEILRARGGTLFLDEVANMSMTSQAKLLRVLEDGKVTPVGAPEAQLVDVRWLAATNRDLFREDVPFRPDLLRRLSSYVARLPPLRQRREDLGTLSTYLLREAGFARASVTAPAGRALFAGPLPGNVRQLRTMLRSAALLAGDQPIDVAHLPMHDLALEGPVCHPSAPAAPVLSTNGGMGVRGSGKRPGPTPVPAEIRGALLQTGGNVVHAAQILRTYPRQLYRWLERYSISLEDFRK